MLLMLNSKTKKHLIVIAVTTPLLFILEAIRISDGWDLKMHSWNKACGDLSILYIMIALSIGALSKIKPTLGNLTLWARPIGIWSMVLALGHIVIVIGGWEDWNILILFGFSIVNGGSLEFTMPGFSFANITGLVAVFYGLVLLLTSNDFSVNKLGYKGWKYLQQRCVYSLYILAALHTFYFLLFFYYSYGRQTPPPNFFITLFPILVVMLFITHCISFYKVVKNK